MLCRVVVVVLLLCVSLSFSFDYNGNVEENESYTTSPMMSESKTSSVHSRSLSEACFARCERRVAIYGGWCESAAFFGADVLCLLLNIDEDFICDKMIATVLAKGGVCDTNVHEIVCLKCGLVLNSDHILHILHTFDNQEMDALSEALTNSTMATNEEVMNVAALTNLPGLRRAARTFVRLRQDVHRLMESVFTDDLSSTSSWSLLEWSLLGLVKLQALLSPSNSVMTTSSSWCQLIRVDQVERVRLALLMVVNVTLKELKVSNSEKDTLNTLFKTWREQEIHFHRDMCQ